MQNAQRNGVFFFQILYSSLMSLRSTTPASLALESSAASLIAVEGRSKVQGGSSSNGCLGKKWQWGSPATLWGVLGQYIVIGTRSGLVCGRWRQVGGAEGLAWVGEAREIPRQARATSVGLHTKKEPHIQKSFFFPARHVQVSRPMFSNSTRNAPSNLSFICVLFLSAANAVLDFPWLVLCFGV